MKWNRRFLCGGMILSSLLLVAALVFGLLNVLFPLPKEWLSPPSGTRVLDRSGIELRRFLATDSMWRFPVTLQEVSPDLIKALVESEDRWFYVHPGVNPLAIVRAAWNNLVAGQVVSGASTIPMQIARMSDPRTRTLDAKVIEAFRAIQLSITYSKTELLEAYLNLAPFGGNIMGVGAASLLYFDKPPSQLSLGESALLAVLPRAPNRYNPARHPDRAMVIRDQVLELLTERKVVDSAEATRAMRQPMIAHRRPSPMLAPHFSLFAKHRLGAEPNLVTTLDITKQRTLEQLLFRHVLRIRQEGITNAAAVILDRKTREVIAMVGSVDFFDDKTQGQVNNAISRRSPGSTLKPFLYALAFDQGLAIPESRILDVPTDFAGYTPENYSGTFSGQVTVAEALSRSLNVPAVRLLTRVGLNDFYDLLKKGGLETINRPASFYGLPLALGTCEVRLLDLANLYATLAEGGRHRPWRIVRHSDEAELQLFSPEASRVISQILTKVTRPDMPDSWRLTQDRPIAAWKTGTSFGHRDAWAIGFDDAIVVGVWVGNPDGKVVKGISGAVHAGPLFFDILRALATGARDLHLAEAYDLRPVRICTTSHLLAGPDCPETYKASAGPTLKLDRCPDHKRVLVDAETGDLLEGNCVMTRPAISKVIRTVPPELAAWLSSQGKSVPKLPPLSAYCSDVPGGKAPTIISPSATTTYVIRHDTPSRFQKINLKAVSSDPGQTLWWYIDGGFVGTTSDKKTLFYSMQLGRHQVSVSDGAGRSHTVEFDVIR